MFLIFIFISFVFNLVDYEVVKAAASSSDSLQYKYIELNYTQPKYTMHGHLFIIDNPISFFKVYPPSKKGCACRETTSNSVKDYGCRIGSNAGFFIMSTGLTDYCLGNIVSDSKILHYDSVDSNINFKETINTPRISGPQVNFGINEKGEFIIGFLEKESIQDMKFAQLISGIIWLSRNGTNYVKQSQKVEGVGTSFIDLAAPRTAIGTTKDGKLMIAVFQGSESKKEGPDLNYLADKMIENGAWDMINLDGGGSSTIMENGKKIWPTSYEREVTTILCVLDK